MRKTAIALLFAVLALPVLPVLAQQRLTPDEAAFNRLPADLQAMLKHLPPDEALRRVALARQNLIALGVPHPTHEQLRATVARLGSDGYSVEGASAGATSFPPLSPLVSPHTPPR